jgi:hypothetical protein
VNCDDKSLCGVVGGFRVPKRPGKGTVIEFAAPCLEGNLRCPRHDRQNNLPPSFQDPLWLFPPPFLAAGTVASLGGPSERAWGPQWRMNRPGASSGREHRRHGLSDASPEARPRKKDFLASWTPPPPLNSPHSPPPVSDGTPCDLRMRIVAVFLSLSAAFSALLSPRSFISPLSKTLPSLTASEKKTKKSTTRPHQQLFLRCSASPSPARSSPSSRSSRRPAPACSPTGPPGSPRTTAAPRRG